MTTLTCRLSRAALLAMTTGLGFVALPALAQEVTLTIARGVDADGLDPYRVSTTQSSQMTGLIYDTLVTLDETGGVNPGLATGHSLSDDNLTYSFTIREGVACHDGAPFTADDVVWSFTRALAPETANPRRANWGPIAEVSAEGNVVTVTLEEPFGPFLSYLGSYSTPMMCQGAIAEDGAGARDAGNVIGQDLEFLQRDRPAHGPQRARPLAIGVIDGLGLLATGGREQVRHLDASRLPGVSAR